MKKPQKTDKEDLLQKIVASSELSATKQRLGLFSMPVPLALGARTFEPKRANKDGDGKVVTEKRGVYTGANRRGALPKDLFDGSTLLTDGKFPDPFFDRKGHSRCARSLPFSDNRRDKENLQKKLHKDPFYLTTSKWGVYGGEGRKRRLGNPYDYMSNKGRVKKRDIKDPDGKVIIGGGFVVIYMYIYIGI